MNTQPSVEIKKEADKFCEYFLKEHPLFISGRNGTITKYQLGLYIFNLWSFIRLTFKHLQDAKAASERIGDLEFAKFMEHTYKEEFGHDKWAYKDMKNLDFNVTYEGDSDQFYITPSISKLFTFLNDITKNEPRIYIAFQFLAEYITAELGPKFVEYLVENCGFDKKDLSVVVNHVELDAEHGEEDLKALDQFITTEEEYRKSMNCLQFGIECLDNFYREVAGAKIENKQFQGLHRDVSAFF